MLLVRDLTEVLVSDLNFERAQAFASKMQTKLAKYQTKIKAVKTGNEAVRDADIIISVTPSHQPVYDFGNVKKGATICGVGSYQPQMEETPAELVAHADKIYFDAKKAVLAEAGDIIIPLNQGMIDENHLMGEIGKVISGELAGRENDEETIFFKTVGIAAQDLMTAKAMYDKAVITKN